MQKKYKIILGIIIVLLLIVIGIGVFKIFFSEEEKEVINTAEVVDSIEGYDYTLDERDTEYMASVFNELKSILEADEIDYEEYAKKLSQLFIIDFYTLDNKINMYDVGSLEYIYTDKVSEFKQKAMDTIYKSLIDNSYGDRMQELPIITLVTVEGLTTKEIEFNETTVEAYVVTLTFEYDSNLGYDTEGTIYLIKNNDKLEIIKYEPSIEEIEESE